MASSCQHAFGCGYTNRRYDTRGFFLGFSLATPTRRMMRASDATDGTGSDPSERIFTCTLIGPWSRPGCSNAARTAIARSATSSTIRFGLDDGRRERGSIGAAGPSTPARFRIS